jgi:hypothetical protein
MICGVNLLGARRRSEQAGRSMQPVGVGLDGKGRIFGMRVRFALKGGQKILNGNCIFSGYN